MALTKPITMDTGVVLSNAYIKIVNICFKMNTNLQNIVEIVVNIYESKTSRDNFLPEIFQSTHKITGSMETQYFNTNVLSQDGINPIDQAYAFLKTLPFYSDATDVIDQKE